MEALLTLLGLAAGCALLATPILAILAFARARAGGPLDRRLAALERELAELRRRMGAEQRAPAEGEPAAPAPESAPRAPIEPVPPATPLRPAAAVPPPPTPAAPPPPAPAPPWEGIEWERLFGVRAAAVLGGVALALAGLLFFKYSIEHGLIPPWLRVVLGTVTGVAAIASSEWKLRPRYTGTADALAGGGVVVLYAAFWAAAVRYDLVPIAAGFVLMASVTAAAAVLAWRHAAQVIALLGLAGGMATPLVLSTGADRPIGLFGYLLLLDASVLALARARRWPRLVVLSLAGTVFYQAVWIAERMGPDRLFLGIGILAVFALFFAAAARDVPSEDRREWLISQSAAVLVPFGFALYLAGNARLGAHLYPIGMMLVLLCTAAAWLARVQRTHWLGTAAAAASLGVSAVFLLARRVDAALAWEIVAVAVVLGVVFHLFVELEPAAPVRDGPTPAAAVAGIGFLALLVLGALHAEAAPLWPWLAGWAALAALLWRHAGFPEREWLQLAAALGMGLGLTSTYRVHGQSATFPPLSLYLAAGVASAVAFQAGALVQRAPRARALAEHAAALLPVVLLLLLAPQRNAPVPADAPFLIATTVLGLLGALAATRLASAPWLLAAFGATALTHWAWTHTLLEVRSAPLIGLAVQSVAVLVFTAWPFLTADRFRAERHAWYGAALVAPAWFLSLRRLFELRFGDGVIGLLPLLLGLVSLAAVAGARRAPAAPVRTGAIAWFAAAAMGFVTVAIPLQLEKEWITIGWALEGLAVTALWTRLDYPGLKWLGLALLAGATVRLVANPALLGYYPRPEWRIVNWLLYTYLVPAGALLATALLLGRNELERARTWELDTVYRSGRPLGAAGAGLAGLIVIFAWINLAIADWFSTGATLMVSFERLPARDLATSIAWAVYALVLLTLGVARASIGLRWVSLGLLLITIAKVFLHDLGELRDLYRVASLLGLAVSLLAVSLAYQRFVFRPARPEGTP